jgi:myotubularin-related protein 6/7/8
MESTLLIVKAIHAGNHVLIHCSDGWDRTAQLSSLVSICLDPHYRTIQGLQALIEKEWLSFGHKFNDRLGHIYKHGPASIGHSTSSSSSSKDEKETAPVFQQFLEVAHNIMVQFPHHFEFNERFLVDIHQAAYSCQFGTFLLNNQRERKEMNLADRTTSFWSYVNENVDDYRSHLFRPSDTNDVLWISVTPKDVPYWAGLYSRFDDEVSAGESMYSHQYSRNAYRRFAARSVGDAVEVLQRRLNQIQHSTALFQHQKTVTEARLINLQKAAHDRGLSLPEAKILLPQPIQAQSLLPPKQSACSLCHGIFFIADPQWHCSWCSQVVCASCSRHTLSLADITQTKTETNARCRSCDACYGRVQKKK